MASKRHGVVNNDGGAKCIARQLRGPENADELGSEAKGGPWRIAATRIRQPHHAASKSGKEISTAGRKY